MPPARGDHEARRRDVSEAVWGVLAEGGFGGLTLRAVAARMGASTGLLTHYFPTKHALLAHALDLLDERREQRRRSPASTSEQRAPGLGGLRQALLDILPLTPEAAADNRVWVSSWDVSLADPALARAQAERYQRSRARLRAHAAAARDAGDLPGSADPDELAAAAVAFAHGLVVQALFDPAAFPAERQTALLDAFMRSASCGY